MVKAPTSTIKNDAYRPYIVIAFGITWLLWGISLALNQSRGYLMPAPGNIIALIQNGFQNSEHIIISIIFALANFGPLLAAIYAIRTERGKKDLADLWKNIFSFKVERIWVIRAVVISLLIAAIPFLLAIITGWMPNPGAVLSALLPYFLPIFIWQLLSSGFGEEPGWRGYLLRKLQSRYEGNKAIWVLGLIWAVWHYPFTIYWKANGMAGEESIAVIATVIIALAGFTISIIGITHLHVWLYNNTGSVLLAIVFHAFNNVFPTILSIEGIPQLAFVAGFMPWVIVFYLERRLGKDKFPGKVMAAN
ncbi:MAG: CPBP family intramembrane metalloprotease [Anaerolineales bacterium]|nr:CPBP family intramembrane metalloprotease [Anaerolineales bacterium]